MDQVLGMIFWTFISLVLIANVSGDCEDDLVPLEAGQLPRELNFGTIPHTFYNSRHMRGVAFYREFKITGLDTAKISLHFCPTNFTFYGNVTARRLQFTGYYTSNVDYLNHGSQIFSQGDGYFNMAFMNLQVKNIIAPLRYSRATKKLQIHDDIQYEAYEEIALQNLVGFEADEEQEGIHAKGKEEFIKMEKSSASPSLIESIKCLINYKSRKGILLGAANQMFASALSP